MSKGNHRFDLSTTLLRCHVHNTADAMYSHGHSRLAALSLHRDIGTVKFMDKYALRHSVFAHKHSDLHAYSSLFS